MIDEKDGGIWVRQITSVHIRYWPKADILRRSIRCPFWCPGLSGYGLS